VSQADVEAIERLYALWNGEGGMLSAIPMFAPDCEYVNPETALEPGTHVGHAGMHTALEALEAAFEGDFVHDPERLIDAGGGKVLAYVTFRARGRDSGVPVEMPEQHVWTLDNGQIVRFQWFHDATEAKLAAGL
jgi:ketosteroid isomerase-like protein